MAEVLVLIDHANGEVKKPAAEMLTIARRLGEPSAVFIGPGAETAKADCPALPTTLEELVEMLTWLQLGFHAKPVGVLNAAGFYDGLASLFDHMVQEGFLRAGSRDSVIWAATPEALLEQLRRG